jgi:NADH-quinone oxidoreductase subunit J
MTAYQIVFLITAVVALGAAVMVVSARSLVHSALWLILTLFGVAVMFALLSAPFFTVVQVVIYIGAISILMIFAIMLTSRVMQDTGTRVNQGWWLALLLSFLCSRSFDSTWRFHNSPGAAREIDQVNWGVALFALR